VIQIGGSVESAIKGEYNINVALVLKEAWQKTQHSRRAINGGLAFVMLLGMVISYLFSIYWGGVENAFKDPKALILLQTIITLAIWPFLAGVEMMGVLHAVGIETKTKLIFSFLKRGSFVVICSLFTSILISVGLQLLVFPGIFLAVAFSLTIPLVVEKKLSPLKAMIISLQATRFQWFKLFAAYLVLIAIFFCAVAPLLLFGQSNAGFIAVVIFIFCLSYLAPMFYNVKGILYREIFGLTMQTTNNTLSSSDNVFLA